MLFRILRIGLFVGFCLFSAQVVSGDWHHWEWVNPKPHGKRLQGVAASDSLIVAVGISGTIFVSEDGLNWEHALSLGGGLYLEDVVWTGTRFVAVGGYSLGLGEPAYHPGVIYASDDGWNWEKVFEAEGTIFHNVHFNGSQVLAVGFNGMTAVSPDGIHWTANGILGFPDCELFDVAWNGSVYVAVGIDGYFNPLRHILVSTDGVNWTEPDLSNVYYCGLYSVIWHDNRFLVFGGYLLGGRGYLFSSPDGLEWTVEPSPPSDIVSESIVSPEGIIGVMDDGIIVRSPDGSTWTETQGVPVEESLNDLAAFQGKYVAVGENGATTLSSDGTHWESVTTWALDFVDSDDIEDVCFAEGTTVVTNGFGEVFRSADFLTWQKTAEFGVPVFAIERLNDAFWIVGDYGLIARSCDGIDWEIRHAGSDGDYFGIASNGSTLVAVGMDVWDGDAQIATSTDGFSWNETKYDDLEGLALLSVCWTGNRFLVVGEGLIASSPDGYSWTFEPQDFRFRREKIISNGVKTLMIGWELNSPQISVSDDHGLSWETIEGDATLRDIDWTGDRFVILTPANVWSSYQGQFWRYSRIGMAGSGGRLSGTEEQLVITGSNGRILRAQRVVPLVDQAGQHPE